MKSRCGWFVAHILVSMLANSSRAVESADPLAERAKAALAQIAGKIALPGLKEPVEVSRDRWGVPHIYAKNQEDLFFAQGFVAAQDRLFQIDLWRRLAVGETAEILGEKALEGDRFARLIRYRGDPTAEWTSYSPDSQAILTAFTSGVNACIEHLGSRLPIEFQILGIQPKKWKPEDCLGRMSGIIMTGNFRNEIARAELVAAVGIEKARWIAPVDPYRDYAAAPGLNLASIDRAILTGYNTAIRPFQFPSAAPGSNNWAVDGTLSASGKPLLASDPHRSIELPSLRYLVHLNAPGWNVIGSGEPALPGVALGHNERIAWGFTIVGTDQADLYVEETNPREPREYRVNGRWEKMRVVQESIRVKGKSNPVEVELRFTRHGPVIHQDEKSQRAYALRWVGNEPGGAAYLGCLAIDRAGNWREFLEAMKAWKSPGENMMYADVDGNIGWIAAGLKPMRPHHDGLLPVPGSTNDFEWDGYLPIADLPQARNPPSHFLATANHKILPNGYAHPISYEWAAPYRFQQIEKRLQAQTRFDVSDFQSIQHENTSIPGQTLARLAKTMTVTDPGLQPYQKLISEWDGVLSRESKAAPLYAIWLNELLDAFYRPHVPAKVLEFARSRGGVAVLVTALEKPDRNWFGDQPTEGRDRLLRETFPRAVQNDEDGAGERLAAVVVGQIAHGHFPPSAFRPGIELSSAFNLGPVGRPGDGLTPHAASHNASYQQISGASYRQIFDLADWDRGLATSAPGQSGQPGSSHYGDLLPLWAEGKYFPLAFSRTKVESVTLHRLVLEPRGRETP